MSYNYRTPAEKIISTLPSISSENVSSTQSESFLNHEKRYGNFFNFALTDAQKEFLSRAGVYLSPHSFIPHSHAACKTIENYFLYVIIADYIKSFRSLYVVSMKESKLKLLKSSNDNVTPCFTLLNRLFDVKDTFRYSSCKDNNVKISFPSIVLDRDSSKVDPIVNSGLPINGSFVFHDEMHYWSRKTFFNFFRVAKPKFVLATVVFPVEVLSGATESLMPDIYEFELRGDSLIFAPDGQFSESYEQPLDLRWLFEASKFVVDGTTFSVEIIKTIGAHHLFAIVSGERVSKGVRIFRNFDALDLSSFSDLKFKYPVPHVRFSFFQKLVVYLKSLKKPDVQSAIAKLRQLEGDSIKLPEMLFTEDFARRLTRHGNTTLATDTLWEMFISSMKVVIPSICLRLFNGFEADRMLRQIATAKTFSVEIKTRVVQETTIFDRLFTGADFLARKIAGQSPVTATEPVKSLDCDNLLYKQIIPRSACGDPKYGMFGDLSPLEFYNSLGVSVLSDRSYLMTKSGASTSYSITLSGISRPLSEGWHFEDGVGSKYKLRRSLLCEYVRFPKYYSYKGRSDKAWRDALEFAFSLEVANNIAFYIGYGVRDRSGFMPTWLTDFTAFKWQDRIGCSGQATEIGRDLPVVEVINDTDYIDKLIEAIELGDLTVSDKIDDEINEFTKSLISGRVKHTNRELRDSVNVDCESSHEKAGTEDSSLDCDLIELAAKVQELRALESIGESVTPLDFPSDIKELQVTSLSDLICYQPRGFMDDGLASRLEDLVHIEELVRVGTRKAIFFCKQSQFDYGHGKVRYPNAGWPRAVADLVRMVNLETGFSFNSALFNVYHCGKKLTFHSDDEHVYDLHSNPVYTLNLTGVGNFVIKMKDDSETKAIELSPGDVLLMKQGAQLQMLHSVTAVTERISITLREQMRPFSTPKVIVDKLGEDALSGLKNNCYLEALSESMKVRVKDLYDRIFDTDAGMALKIAEDRGLTLVESERCAELLGLRVQVLHQGMWLHHGPESASFRVIKLILNGHHFIPFNDTKLRDDFPSLVLQKVVDNQDPTLFFENLIKASDPSEVLTNRFDTLVNFDRAFTLLRSFLSGSTGVISSSSFGKGLAMFSKNGLLSEADDLTTPGVFKSKVGGDFCFDGVIYMGFAGCGKSRPVQQALNSVDSGINVLVVSPRKLLLNDWEGKVKAKNVSFKTFELALKENLSNYGVIVLDELGLYPRGFTDLIVCKAKFDVSHQSYKMHLPKLVLLGDPAQAAYFNENDSSSLPVGCEFKRLEIDCPKYLLLSHRISRTLAGIFDINLLGPSSGFNGFEVFSSVQSAMANGKVHFDAVLTASRAEKELFQGHENVMTFGESQGLTFNNTLISLSEATLSTSANHQMVALTRAREGFSFVLNYRSGLSYFKTSAGNSLIGKVLNGKIIKKSEIKAIANLEDMIFIEQEERNGSVEEEERFIGDPFLKAMMSLVEDVVVQEPELDEFPCKEAIPKVHIPIADRSFAITCISDSIRAKETREYRIKENVSDQFKDDDKNINLNTSTGPVNFESIFPRHKAFDEVTFLMAVRKRLSTSNPIKECRKLSKAWVRGQILFNEFQKVMRVKSGFRPDLLDQALIDFERVRNQKSSKLIEAHAGRSDPDWNVRKFLLFMKSQLCKKTEKEFCDAKAGQTIACFAHSVLFKFAKWCRYAEFKINESLPDSMYIHCRKNFDEMERWVKRNYIGPVCLESDYEAFDSSQDEVILAFESLLLRHVGWPEDLINDYIDLKTNLGCRLGNLVIMRFSGEFGTFFFNTMANIAFSVCRYHINRQTPACFAGDDMAILCDVRVRHDLDDFIDGLKLKAKVERKRNPTFCGWILSKFGLMKMPSLIYYRLMIAREKGNLKDCIDSYMVEASYGYLKGDNVYYFLDEVQLQFHQLAIRELVKHKHLMRGLSLHLLESISGSSTDGI